MRIFLDTNVLLDFILDGRQNNNTAKQLFQLLRARTLEPYVTTQSIMDMVYIASRSDHAGALRFVDYLLGHFNVRPVESFSLRLALESEQEDFEDSALLSCAEELECDVFITSDSGILSRKIPSLQIMTPGQFTDRLR